MKTILTLRSRKIALLAPLMLTGLTAAPHAWADSIELLAQTTLVNGTEATTDTFFAPTAGKVTVKLTDTGWSSPLTALSFTASSGNQVLSSFKAGGMDSVQYTFNVGPGAYFANIMATAATGNGLLGLGLYSLNMSFTPSAVPLPSTGWLLLTGLFALIGVARAARPTEFMGTAAA